MMRSNRRRWMASVLLLAACGGGAESAGTATGGDALASVGGIPTYQAVAWPELPNDWVLGLASGVANDAQDHIWVIHRPRTVVAADRERMSRAGEGRTT